MVSYQSQKTGRLHGSHLKTLTRLSRVQLLISDDFLLTPLSDWERRDLLEVGEDRYQAGATVITSRWHTLTGQVAHFGAVWWPTFTGIRKEIWWNEYYAPLEMRIHEIRAKAADNPKVIIVLDDEQQEIEMVKQNPRRYRSGSVKIRRRPNGRLFYF